VAVAAVEVLLYLSYRSHDARFHWLTHFLVGASTALIVMAAWTWFRRRPAPFPLVWVVAAHLFAMVPDFLFQAGVAHEWWMDLFLLHVRSHFVPGRNLTWLVVFGFALTAYLVTVDRRVRSGDLFRLAPA
jgi:hypothetical protein